MENGIVYHWDILQGGDEWRAKRCGLITASQMKHLVTEKTLKSCDNDKSRAIIYELAAQRIMNLQPEGYQSFDMLRGEKEEVLAKDLYAEHYGPVKDCGFITNNRLGFVIGMSPDGLVGDGGIIEVKSRAAKFQVQTIIEGTVPSEFRAQIEGGFLVTERKWTDFLSYSNGMHMLPIRCLPTPEWQQALSEACKVAEEKIVAIVDDYKTKVEHLYKAPFVDVMAELNGDIKPSDPVRYLMAG